MTKRERIRAIIARKPADRCGFWLGNPHPDSWPGLHRYFGTTTENELRRKLGDDFAWISPQLYPNRGYFHPRGRQMFDLEMEKTHHGQAGPLANAETVADVDRYEWPDPSYEDFSACLTDLRQAGDVYRASGMWTCFYHDIMDLFGMENYMVKMYTHPEVVEAVTDRVCEFYYQANERFFPLAGDLVDGFFFGNDFGTQRDLICGLKQFDRFILPWFRKFTDQGHRHGLQVILHSCGSIYRVIPRLIDAGVDCLHPLQAKAANMDAVTLANAFQGKIAFLGGIDAQDVLVHATPAQLKAEIRRVRDLLGLNLIISPSHEAILPDVPPENVAALAEAAAE
jgi:uroporphyrinogen decarboxylase